MNKYYITNSLILLMTVILFSSCLTQKKIEYLRSRDSYVKEFPNNTFEEYRLKSNDELYIQISSFDDAANFSSGSMSQNANLSNPFGASLQSHTIDKNGFLELPVIGKLLVKGKTIPEVKDALREALVNILSQPVITVKLVNKYISVFGEVNGAGHFPYSQETITIFDALSLAGDITDYGNRKSVILIREINGKVMKRSINLSKDEFLASEFYYLQPNDIIYVKPLNVKIWSRRTGSLTTFLTLANLVILIINMYSTN